jgi:homoserine kinase
MMDGDMLVIQVPGSTANLGPGFDSVGLALSLYLRLEVERSNHWEIVMLSEELEGLPKDESNYIIQIAIKTAKKFQKPLPECRIRMSSDIPLARGLGSSAAAIVAGIELANSVGNLQLSEEEKFKLASEIEGHPDNVGPSLFGGLVIGSQQESDVEAVVYNDLQFEVVAAVPKEELLTKASRRVLPSEMPFQEAVKASSISNVLVAALLRGDYPLAGKMMKKDLYHQPYRRKLVPHLKPLEDLAIASGAFGVALSGAGPTVICCCEIGKGDELLKKLETYHSEMDYLCLQIDNKGSQIHMQNSVKK